MPCKRWYGTECTVTLRSDQRASRHVSWSLPCQRLPETMPRYATHSPGSPPSATAVELRRCDATLMPHGCAWLPRSHHTAEATGSTTCHPTSTNALANPLRDARCQQITV